MDINSKSDRRVIQEMFTDTYADDKCAYCGAILPCKCRFERMKHEDVFEVSAQSALRTFSGGATRNNDPNRIDFLRMLSLPVLFAYADYMRRNRNQYDKDGNLLHIRDFDNWKRGGFPPHETAESLFRHTLDLGALTDGVEPMRPCNIPDTCCALIFGAAAYLHKYLEELNK